MALFRITPEAALFRGAAAVNFGPRPRTTINIATPNPLWIVLSIAA